MTPPGSRWPRRTGDAAVGAGGAQADRLALVAVVAVPAEPGASLCRIALMHQLTIQQHKQERLLLTARAVGSASLGGSVLLEFKVALSEIVVVKESILVLGVIGSAESRQGCLVGVLVDLSHGIRVVASSKNTEEVGYGWHVSFALTSNLGQVLHTSGGTSASDSEGLGHPAGASIGDISWNVE